MPTVALHSTSIELACCHLIAMTDMKGILQHEWKLGPYAPNPRMDDNGLDGMTVNLSHVDMMNKAINILKREKIDPNEYRFALAHARTLSDSERTNIAIDSRFFSELISEEALNAIIGCVDME